MKEIKIEYTIIDTIYVPEDSTNDQIQELVDKREDEVNNILLLGHIALSTPITEWEIYER